MQCRAGSHGWLGTNERIPAPSPNRLLHPLCANANNVTNERVYARPQKFMLIAFPLRARAHDEGFSLLLLLARSTRPACARKCTKTNGTCVEGNCISDAHSRERLIIRSPICALKEGLNPRPSAAASRFRRYEFVLLSSAAAAAGGGKC